MMFARRTDSAAWVRKRERWLIALILLLAAMLRIRDLDFGLPALNDADEPLFIMTALDMLREGRLNPGWFGHPATLLFYLLAIVIVAVGAAGNVIGAWSGSEGFVTALFSDPGIAVLPMRALIAGFGVASIWLTWRIGRRVGGPPIGLGAALLLACNALHVELSQVVRTDMLATLLMQWSLLHALAIARGGSLRDHVWAGIAAGLACATKWPGLLVLAGAVAATCWAARHDRRALRRLPIAPLVAAATLLTISPYLLLDLGTVLHDLGGEARPQHVGVTGHGLWGNLVWYVRYPLAQSFGWEGVALAGLGAAFLVRDRDRGAAVVLLPAGTVLLLALAAQSLVWERWAVPLLPLVAILAALALARLAGERFGLLGAVGLIALAAWSAYGAIDRQQRRADDPRQVAARWIMAHVPPGRAILVEHAAFDLLGYDGRLLFPLGNAGCVDARQVLARRPSHRRVEQQRHGSAIVDIGHLSSDSIARCGRADLIVTSHRLRYQADARRFPMQGANYRRLLDPYRRVAIFTGGISQTPGRSRSVEIFARK